MEKNAIKPERFPALELTKLAKLVMSFRFGFGMIQKDLNGLGFNFGTKRRIKVRNWYLEISRVLKQAINLND